ncbi:MAG: hypothetical protein M1834_003751 [Cirrosporium novae-zelandiae]|nr:MAG: hypothetical protein M1834_003751 [Cirrosporium novae-zelandiae]
MPPIKEGDTFSSIQAFKDALIQWSIEADFVPLAKESRPKKVRYGCRASNDCPFVVNATWRPSKQIAIVTRLQADHTCTGSADVKKQPMSSLKWLTNHVPLLLPVVDEDTSTKEIQTKVHEKYGVKVDLRQCQRVKRVLIQHGVPELDDHALDESPNKRPRLDFQEDVTDQAGPSTQTGYSQSLNDQGSPLQAFGQVNDQQVSINQTQPNDQPSTPQHLHINPAIPRQYSFTPLSSAARTTPTTPAEQLIEIEEHRHQQEIRDITERHQIEARNLRETQERERQELELKQKLELAEKRLSFEKKCVQLLRRP